jgi:hypothetical protein
MNSLPRCRRIRRTGCISIGTVRRTQPIFGVGVTVVVSLRAAFVALSWRATSTEVPAQVHVTNSVRDDVERLHP